MGRRIAVPLAMSVLSGSIACAADITDQRLLAAGSDKTEWLMNGRTYAADRFSPLDQIDTGNVTKLAPAWIYQTGKAATFQSTPLVADGVLYLSEPMSSVTALDAKTGAKLWHYAYKATTKALCCGPANRGVGLGYGKVFIATVDAHLVALDAKTGKLAWDVVLATAQADTAESNAMMKGVGNDATRQASGQSGYGANSAPLVYDGKVFAGVVGVGYGLHLESERPNAPLGTVVGIAGKYGASGFLGAYDAQTGKRVWQWDTTQPGWEGDYVQKTSYGVSLPRDIAHEKVEDAHDKEAKSDEAWKYGGGSMWNTPSLDPELGLLYFGTGNPSPQATGTGRPGDNLWTVSVVALDVKTGTLKWGFQQVPHDLWGYDVASPTSLFDVTVDGKSVPAVGEASKIGWYFVNDRRDGRLLFKSEPFVPQRNLFAKPSPEGVTISPGVGGGASWSPVSIDTKKGVAYIAAMHLPTTFKTAVLPAADGKPPVDYTTAEPADVPRFGTLTALDLKHEGKILWQAKTPQPLVGGVVATAGGLVFTGEGGGDFDAYDSASGKKLWRFACGAGVNAPPITYAVDGRQYVAVAAGGSAIWGYPQGDALMVFALPK